MSAAVSLTDAGGLFGVAIILAAYAAATLGRLNPEGAPSLAINFVGASLILTSLLTQSFNLSAAAMEGSWALVALIGLVRLAVKRWRT
ncbi:MAG: CBU_0592 family membrane protein [Caulobacteraceae bacterium]